MKMYEKNFLKVDPNDNNDMEFNPRIVLEATVPVHDLSFVPHKWQPSKRGRKFKTVKGPNGPLSIPCLKTV